MDMCSNDSGIYVCITHQKMIPCEEGEHHLISNWKPDVDKILELIKERDG